MIVDFQCLSCGHVTEEYFHSWNEMVEVQEKHNIVCVKCGKREMRRLFPAPKTIHSEVPGYEKRNQDHLTIGKRFDSYHSKWV